MIEDRRVRKTKRALRLGLAELLTEKDISQVTVKELVEKVDIHRSTFYANFEDLYDLYQHMEDVVIDEISLIVLGGHSFKPKAFFEILLKYITDHPQISQLFFGGKVSHSFNQRITALFLDCYLDYLCETYQLDRENEQLKYYELFCFAGTLAVIEKWVTGEFACQAEELVEMLEAIDLHWGAFVASRFKS